MNPNQRFHDIRNALLDDVSSALAQLKKDRSLLNERSGLGETLLHWFAIEYRPDIVKSLLDLGAEVDSRNNFAATPCIEAASLGDIEMCTLLLNHGANIDHFDHLDQTALMKAVEVGSFSKLPMFRFLIDKGASITLKNRSGESALSAAIANGQLEIVEWLLTQIAPDLDINDFLDDSAVHTLHEIQSDVTSLLLDRGLRPNPWPTDE